MINSYFKWLWLLALVPLVMLSGCGGGGGGGGGAPKATISGTVTFPSLNNLVSKQVASLGDLTVIVYGLDGSPIKSATVTGANYSVGDLDSGVDYVIKAVAGGKTMKALVDKGSISITTVTTQDLDAIATTALFLAEKKLSVPPGTIGENQNSAVTTFTIALLQPASLENALQEAVNTVKGAATQAKVDLVNMANIVTATIYYGADTAQFLNGTGVTPVNTTQFTLVNNEAVGASAQVISTDAAVKLATASDSYIPPAMFTSSMISGKTFAFQASDGLSGIATFNSNGTANTVTSDGAETPSWQINLSGQLKITFIDGSYDLLTLSSSTSNSITAFDQYVDPVPSYNKTRTMTITLVETPTAIDFSVAAGTYSGTFTATDGPGGTVTMVVDSAGFLTGNASSGATVTGALTYLSANQFIFSATSSTGSVWSGAIDASTRILIGTWYKSEVSRGILSASVGTTAGFTSAMVSGKTFSIQMDDSTSGTIVFNSTSATVIVPVKGANFTGPWSVTPYGQLKVTEPGGGYNLFTAINISLPTIVAVHEYVDPAIPQNYQSGSIVFTQN